MSIAYRAGASVVHGTAGTSVTVPRPAGVVDGDFLLAFIARNGSAMPTAPAGWQLRSSQVGNASSMAGAWYWKIANGEPASWTWTITSAVNIGWVGAYTGVDPSTPFADSTSAATTGGTLFAPGTPLLPRFAMGVSAAAAVRTATGTATTWSPSGTEVADLSTNVGTGTDLTIEVQQTLNPLSQGVHYQPQHTASQAQSQAVALAVTLNAYFAVPAPADELSTTLEAALGADPAADPDTWTWTDLSTRMRGQVTIVRGRGDEAQRTQASQFSVRLANDDGWLTALHPDSPWYGLWDVDTPTRFKVNLALGPFLRFQGKITSIRPDWPSGNSTVAFVDITARGALYDIEALTTPVMSPMTRGISSQLAGAAKPRLYWPFEDAAGSGTVAEFSGGTALVPTASSVVTFGVDTSVPGSAPLARLAAGSVINVEIPALRAPQFHAFGVGAAGEWRIEFVTSLPSAPSADTNLLQWYTTTGTANLWQVRYDQASATIRLRALAASGDLLGDTGIATAGLIGQPLFVVINARQSGTSINWQLDIFLVDRTGNTSHGTAAGFTLGALRRGTIAPTIDGTLFGHLAVFDRADDFAFGLFANVDNVYLDGHAGEDAGTRVLGVLQELGVTNDSPSLWIQTSGQSMGPRPVASGGQILREAEAVDGGILGDGMGPGVTWLPLAQRYNAPAVLALRADQWQVKLPFEPIRDDQRLVDDATVTRTGGGSGRYALPAAQRPGGGPSLNTIDTSTLVDQAALRVALGTVPEMRAPVVTVDLRDSPELIPAWVLHCDIGSRYTLADPPDQYPPGGLDQVLEQYVEVIDGQTWLLYLTGFPFAPFRVFVVDDALGRLETGGTQLTTAIGAADTMLTATTIVDPALTTTADRPDDFLFDIDLRGEHVTVTTIASRVTDTFSRVVSGGWGTADSGQAWTTAGGSGSDYSINGSHALLSMTSVNVKRTATLALGLVDVEVVCTRISQDAAPAGGNFDYAFVARYIDDNNFVDGRLFFLPGGAWTCAVRQVVGGVETVTGFPGVKVIPFGNPALRFQAIGDSLRLKAWTAGAPEPYDWHVEMTTDHTAAGSVRFSALLEPSVTNTLPVTISLDDFSVPNPQTLTVVRAVNGVVKAHPAGTALSLWKPARLAL